MATPWVTTYHLLELVLMKHSDLRPAAGAEGLIVFQLWQSLTVILVGNVLETGGVKVKNSKRQKLSQLLFLLQFTELKEHVIIL